MVDIDKTYIVVLDANGDEWKLPVSLFSTITLGVFDEKGAHRYKMRLGELAEVMVFKMILGARVRVTRLRVWDVIEYEGIYEDYCERLHESFTCPVLAGLCASRRASRLDGTDYWWDEYHGINVRTHVLNATIGERNA